MTTRPGRLRLFSKLEQAEAVAEDMAIERGRFQRLKDREAVRAVSSFNLFQTPAPLAARMAELLPLREALTQADEDFRLLEPSAGLGALYRAVRERSGCEIVLVEQSAECCGELYRTTDGDGAARLVQGDFLQQTADTIGRFDAVLMNPPFKMGTDVKHVRHALTLLRPGGRLVSLVANGPKQNAALMDLATSWEVIPRGTFEATRVEAAMIVIDG
jgi:SAM-dependent methyltransferase